MLRPVLATHLLPCVLTLFVIAVCSPRSSAGELSADEAAAGFHSLFDGRTLQGWQGAIDGYAVEDEAITCIPEKGGNLLTTQEFADFSLRFEFRLPAGGNNGVGLRAPAQGHVATEGFEIQILDNADQKYAKIETWQYHGSVYGLIAAKRGYLQQAGTWNSQEIRCVSRRITVVLNGETIVDGDLDTATEKGTLDGKAHPGLTRTHGHIGFLGHGDRVQYRNIRIQEIAPLDPLVWERRATVLEQPILSVEAIDANADGTKELLALGSDKVWAISSLGDTRLLAHTPGGYTIHGIALDCDADGDQDLAVGRPGSDWIEYRSKQEKGEAPPEPVGPDFTVAWLENTGRTEGAWPLHILDKELHGVHGVWRGDVNRDGAIDLLADSFAGPHLESSLAWFPAPHAAAVSQTSEVSDMTRMPRHLITQGEATGRPHYMDFGDINADGRGDVLLGASTEGSFTWWEQPEDATTPWKRHLIAMEPGATHPRVVDLNGDGRLDILASAGHGVGVMWFSQPASLMAAAGGDEPWTKHTVDTELRDVHSFDAADMDGDGDIDCAGCSFSQRLVRWWENTGHGHFTPHDIDVGQRQEAYDLKIIDLDGDQLLDVILAGRGEQNAVWYRSARKRTK